jgi:hypothetical protein
MKSLCVLDALLSSVHEWKSSRLAAAAHCEAMEQSDEP